MKIAFVSSEVVPFAKTGGLADVAGALPKEIEKLGHEVKVFMPKYYSVDENKFNLKFNHSIGTMSIRTGGHAKSVHIFNGKLPGSNVDVYFIDYPQFFHRHQIYTDDWDEDERFILFQKAVIETIQYLGWAPDVFHINDWQTAIMPILVKDNYSWDRLFDKSAFLFTIHNIGYQGRFSQDTMFRAELKGDYYYPGGPLEYEGGVNFMKAAIHFSEILTTVSETYAKELLTAEYGAGMQDFLRMRKEDLYGIINGVDYDVWNPETDPFIPYKYSMSDLSGKIENKKHLLKEMNLHFDPNIPLIGIISRLAIQKGFDIVSHVINELVHLNAQWIILGSGESKYEDMFRSMAYNFPYKVGFYQGYNNDLSHLIEAGADMFLMPSRYEPCGLNQIYSLKYGTVPIVRKTGGLADTIQDWNEYNSYGMDTGNGYSFNDYSGYALLHSVQRAINDFHNKPVWNKIQMNGMEKEYSWNYSAEKYVELYKRAISKKRGS